MAILKDAIGVKALLTESARESLIPVTTQTLFGHYKSDSYATAYPSIRAIVNDCIQVPVYAIDSNGKKQNSHPIINALYHPNQKDSSIAFFEKIFVSTLVMPNTYILMWHREGLEARPGYTRGQTIAGFTFLESPGISIREDNKVWYNIGANWWSEDEVLCLPGGVNAYDLYGGYSPTHAAGKWLTLDDYIASFQAGFFQNNAIPAGQFIITAESQKDFEDTVELMKRRHAGAGKNGAVTYTPRPVDTSTGKATNAKIEWVPFQQPNKDIDFKNIFEQVNNRIDIAYGVPAIVKGIDDTATYANAQVAERTHAKRAVAPLLLRNWTQFNHELNRITGGTGIAISYTFELPNVSDEEYTDAKTKSVESGIIRDMVDAGYTLDSIIESFKLSTSYKNLKTGKSSTTNIENDKPDVDDGGEVDESPDNKKLNSMGEAISKNPKAQLTSTDEDMYEAKIASVVRGYMQKQVDFAIASLDTNSSAEDGRADDEMTDELMEIIVAIMIYTGAIQYTDGITMLVAAGVNTDAATVFVLSEVQKESYRTYLSGIVNGYNDDTAESIRNVLLRAGTENWDKNTTADALRKVMDTDEYRVQRLATSEVNKSQAQGMVSAMKQLESEAECSIEKRMNHDNIDAPCEFCAYMLGQWFNVGEIMIEKDTLIKGVDGGIYNYTWDDNDGHDIHPNGHCTPEFRVAPS